MPSSAHPARRVQPLSLSECCAMMTLILLLAVTIILAAIVASTRGIDVRFTLGVAALLLGALAGDLPAIGRAFFDTFSSEKFIVPICSAMGFAYVLKHTGSDVALVRLLLMLIRPVRGLLVPGVVVVGFVVNVPLISQTSTAVCLGTVVVPLMLAAGYSKRTIGSTLLLGASIGGELLNPGAPELLSVKKFTGTDTQILTHQYIPQLVFPLLAITAVAFWIQTIWLERKTVSAVTVPEANSEPANLFRAAVPLVPLALLLLSGPPFELFHIPDHWLAIGSADVPHPEKLLRSRQIGLAMLVGVAVAALAAPRRAKGCMKAFFDGAGYGFANIVSLIVIATCFGEGIRVVGLAAVLGEFIAGNPGWLHPLTAAVPWAFAWVSGSGMASTQSLFEFFVGPSAALNQDPNAIGAMVSVGSAVGRTMSPVAAVTLMCAGLTGETPLALVKRVAGPLLLGLVAVVILRMLGWV